MGLDRVGQILGDVILAGLAVVVTVIAIAFLALAASFIKKVFFE